MRELQHLPAKAKTKDIVEAVNADGACIIDNLIAADNLAALNAELAPYINATEHGP